jgi:hypothetical protein
LEINIAELLAVGDRHDRLEGAGGDPRDAPLHL